MARAHVTIRFMTRRKCLRKTYQRFTKRRSARYCSQKCQLENQYEEYIARWLTGEIEGTTTSFDKPSVHIRRYLMETGGFQCGICGWGERNPRTGRVPLHVDHIDGDARNNRPENLRLLCPNHHALTETYGNANHGKGRAGRRARYLKGVRFSPLVVTLRSERRATRSRPFAAGAGRRGCSDNIRPALRRSRNRGCA